MPTTDLSKDTPRLPAGQCVQVKQFRGRMSLANLSTTATARYKVVNPDTSQVLYSGELQPATGCEEQIKERQSTLDIINESNGTEIQVLLRPDPE